MNTGSLDFGEADSELTGFLLKMQNSKSRSESFEIQPRQMQPSKSIRGLNFPLENSDSLRAAKVFDKKPSNKPSSLLEKRIGRSSEMQPQFHQFQEELRRAREERTRALEDLEEVRSNKRMLALSNKEEMENLDKKVEKAKESERKMLESLVSQTKQLEQAKILLEEAKLEIHELRDGIKFFEENSSCNSDENRKDQQSPLALIQAQEEIRALRNELKLATEAEEKSKMAMDDLAIALKEVTTETNQVKVRLSTTESDLEKVRFESEQSKSLVKVADDKLRAAVEESERLKLESEDLVLVIKEKENGFMNCMKVPEGEIVKLKSENTKLIESLRGSRDETSKLRDIVKQAVNESTVVKEALEIARNENSSLKDSLSKKENALQIIRHEYESLKVSEAAAVDSVKELKGFLAATSSMDSTTKISENEIKRTIKFPSGRFGKSDSMFPKRQRHLVGGSGKFNRRNQLLSSLSNVSDSCVPSFLYTENRESLSTVDIDHIARTQSDGTDYESGSPMIKKKKKKMPMLKRFGDMLRRNSFHR